jgi:dGTPase
LNIESIAQRERLLLAPYATHSCESKGRAYPQPEHPYRSCFQRDRDRILHCAAFRRLSGKMQVFTGEMGDYHRTRLTHTQEVASIARTIGRALQLNEDLIEALALVHDIGHPPYGHAGEDVLDHCLKDFGGFSHNRFALTIVQEIEQRYPDFPGLNLTYEVLQGQMHRIDKQQSTELHPLLEVQLVDLADSTTYDAHDTDDAFKLGLVSFEALMHIPLVADCAKKVRQRYASLDQRTEMTATVRQLVEVQVTDLIEHNLQQLAHWNFASAEQARRSDFVLAPSAELAELKQELETFLYAHVYRHPKLMNIREQAQHRLERMYRGFCERPELLPAKYQQRAKQIGIQRMGGEYIAGMTDRFCDNSYALHFATMLQS